MIVSDIQEKIAKGANPGDFAVLYRTHTMSRAIFERLAPSNLPFVIEKDADSFYQRRVIRGMLAFMRLSLFPQDSKAKIGCPFFIIFKAKYTTGIKGTDDTSGL